MIYLDNNASTQCDPRVIDAMLPFFGANCGNPSAVIHAAGRVAADAVDAARRQVATMIGAVPKEIVFTSGATESNNLAILGLANARGNRRRRIVTTAVEHKSVLGPCELLGTREFEMLVLPVDTAGIVLSEAAKCAIDESVLLVSVQLANNETGTIQALSDIATHARRAGALMHCDAAQAVGKIAVDVDALNLDLLSLSAHKMYGPKGIGVLYIRGGPRAIPLDPITVGGGQESGLRPGTINVPGAVGLGTACGLWQDCCEDESEQIAELRDRFETRLLTSIPRVTINGALHRRLPNTSSITLHGIEAETLIANLRGVAVSNGSACASGAPVPSHVLTAMGISREAAYSTLRVGIGRFTTVEEIDAAADLIAETYTRLHFLARRTVSF